MGNACLGTGKKSSNGAVHPVAGYYGAAAAPPEEAAATRVRIKVRMSRRQLRDLLAKMDVNKSTSELASLIMEECLKGKLHACVDADGLESTFKYAKGWDLSPIHEVSEEDDL